MERMHGYDEVIQLFLFTVGATLIQCQAFENRLRQYKLLVYETRPGMTEKDFMDLLAKSRKRDTLGSLLKELAIKTAIEAKTKALLDEFLAERNWFIHHLEYQHGLAVFDLPTLTPIVQRMRDRQRQSTHLQHQIAELTVTWTEKQGFSQVENDAAAREALDGSIKPLT
jgi:hypothetical protein